LCASLVVLLLSIPLASSAQQGYTYFAIGNHVDVVRPTSFGLVLMGGGGDVEEAFRWLIEKSGGGDVVVLRASGSDAYNSWIFGLGKVDSVETIIFSSREAAYNDFVVARIRNAEALWIAGGDQGNYIRYWRDTPVEDAIHHLVKRNVPIGGTSAGLAVLGEFSFAALNDTIRSPEALANPYDSNMTIERSFLHFPQLAGVITDSHFAARDRMGRSVAFLARIRQDGWSPDPRGIAVDERTALLVEESGAARVVGDGAVYFLRTSAAPQRCAAGKPLEISGVKVQRLRRGGKLDLPAWSGSEGVSYSVAASAGKLQSSQPGGAVY
jgi:cyanophycinase